MSDDDDEEDEDEDGEDEDEEEEEEEEEEENEEKAGNDNEDPDNSEGPSATAPTRHSTRLKNRDPNTITPSEEASTLTHTSTVAAAVREQSLPLSPLAPRSTPPVPLSPLAPPSTPSSGPTGTALGCGPASPSQPTRSTTPLPVPTLVCQPSTRPLPPLVTPQTLPKPPIPTQSTTPLPVPTLICQPSTQPSPPLVAPQQLPKPPLPVDSSWPAWFKKAYTDLSLIYLSAELTSAIRLYVDFEEKASFTVGSPHAGFKVDNQPPEVAYWVGRGRKSAPPIKDLTSFEAGWWNWWKGLQPKWRSVVEVKGPLTATHREVADGEGGWAAVDRHGQNAFLTVLSCLVWWGAALNGCQGESEAWTAAVADVHWVLTNLVR